MFLQLSEVNEKIFEILRWYANACILNLKRELDVLNGLIWLWWAWVYLVKIVVRLIDELNVSEDDSYVDTFSLVSKLDGVWKKVE